MTVMSKSLIPAGSYEVTPALSVTCKTSTTEQADISRLGPAVTQLQSQTRTMMPDTIVHRQRHQHLHCQLHQVTPSGLRISFCGSVITRAVAVESKDIWFLLG